MTRYGVCYANWGGTPIDLPGEWAGFSHANYGMADEPWDKPTVTQGVVTRNPGGVVLNYEESTPTGQEVSSFLRKVWKPGDDFGTAIMYGADAGVQNSRVTQPIGIVARSLRRRLPASRPAEYAALGLDGYPRQGYVGKDVLYNNWAKFRLLRLEAVAGINKTPSWWFIDVQNQDTGDPDNMYRHPQIWHWAVIEQQLRPWLPFRDKVNLMVFAGAAGAEARKVVEEAIVRYTDKISNYVERAAQ